MVKQNLFVDGLDSDRIIPVPSPNSFLKTDSSGNWEFGADGYVQNTIKYIVGPVESGAQYQTIQAAIDAAEVTASPSNIALILVYPGSYTESPVISCGGITIAAFGPSSSTYVFGGFTFSPDPTLGAYYTLSNIGIDGYITYSGATSGSGFLYLFNCETSDIIFDFISTGSSLVISDSKVQKITVDNGDSLSLYNCQTDEIIASGAVSMTHSTIFGPVTHTGSFECTVSNSLIQTSTLDTNNYCISSSATANLRLLNVEFRKNNLLGPIIIKSSVGVVLHSGCHWSQSGANVTTPISLSGGATEYPPGRPLSPRVGGVVFPQAVSDQLNWPAGVGTSGQTLITDGVNQLSWGNTTGKFNFVVGPVFTGADYLTIQEAVDAAEAAGSSGLNPATIFVHGGTYSEPEIIVSCGGLNIISSTTNGAYVDGYITFNVDPSNASYYGLANITISGISYFTGTTTGGGSLSITGCGIGGIHASVNAPTGYFVGIDSSSIINGNNSIELSGTGGTLSMIGSSVYLDPTNYTSILSEDDTDLYIDNCTINGKIVQTGSGSCNITNSAISVLDQECLNINSSGASLLDSCG